jgi:hypothetical protein
VADDSDESTREQGDDDLERARNRFRIDLGANGLLLVMLILLLVVLPFASDDDTQRNISRIIWSGVITAGIIKARRRRIFLWAALSIAIPSLLSSWIDLFGFAQAGPLVVALFFGLIAAQILVDIFSEDQVKLDHVLGGINVFLLLGVMFGRLHVAIESSTAGSYILNDLPIGTAVAQSGQYLENVMLYFSYVTLTTLGYGDITPVSELARMLSTIEAVVGQLFVAVLIARLVAAHASNSRPDQVSS